MGDKIVGQNMGLAVPFPIRAQSAGAFAHFNSGRYGFSFGLDCWIALPLLANSASFRSTLVSSLFSSLS